MQVKANLPYHLYKSANFLWRMQIPVLPYLIKVGMRICLGCVIPYQAKIGKNVHFGYMGLGVVLHSKCVIENNVLISQHVTIGGGAATIESDVYIGAGAQIINGVTVGTGAKIGANAVVLKDVPAYCTAVGVPARIIDNIGEIKGGSEL